MKTQVGVRAVVSTTLPWTLETLALLDESHLCAWSDDAGVRREFARGFVEHLCAMPETEVIVLDGGTITGLESFCKAIEIGTGQRLMERRVEGRGGLIDALSTRGVRGDAKRRFIVWLDAHAMLASDAGMFGRLTDALTGTAAEAELVSEDMLLIQRVVFLGRASLDVYAEDPCGQFRTWYAEGRETPLWRVISGQNSPRVRSVRVEALLSGAA